MGRKILSVEDPAFWDEKAGAYPLPGERDGLERTNRIIDLLTARGLSWAGAQVLDIGCGTGEFSLPLAKRGAIVTALDFSKNMLHRLSAEAIRQLPGHVRVIHGSWKEIDIYAMSLERAYDITLSAFSQAVETEEDLRKMERCSQKWCIYIATGEIHRAAALEQVFRTLHLPLNPRPDIRKITPILEKMGRNFLSESLTIMMNDPKTPGKLIEEIAIRLEAAGMRPNRKRIAAGVSSLCPKGEDIACRREAEIGICMWRVDKGKN